jgi:synaptic vesicle membrane protein VAT-1
MRQIWISKIGPPEVLTVQEAPDPTPRAGEVRIRVEAAGINFADIFARQGIYPDAPPAPFVPGYEVAGIVDVVGQGAPDLKEGDHVLAATRFRGYSDVVCVPHKQVFKRLDWMSAEHGAALPLNYLTAYQALIVMGSLCRGDKVLIHNAGGGLGLAALDICRISGVETFGTASPGKHAFLQERGLSHAIDYRSQDYEGVIKEMTNGSGLNLILDPLGGIHWRKNYRLLAPAGRLIHLGASTAVTGKRRSLRALLSLLINLPFYNPLRLINDNKAVIGVQNPRLWDQFDRVRPWLDQIISWYDEALFRPHIDRTFKFSQAAEAHHYIQERKNTGKVLLIP